MSGPRTAMASLNASVRSQRVCLRCSHTTRQFATAITDVSSEPPMLLKMRSDMKNAMRSKDSNRLDVLRGVFGAASNGSKTPVPIDSDSRVLVLLQRQAKSSRAAAAEFEAAKRVDLKAKEDAQLAVLEEYIGSIPTVGDDEVEEAVTKILANLKTNGNHTHYGNVIRDLAGRNGIYASKPLNMERVRNIVQEKIAAQEKKWF